MSQTNVHITLSQQFQQVAATSNKLSLAFGNMSASLLGISHASVKSPEWRLRYVVGKNPQYRSHSFRWILRPSYVSTKQVEKELPSWMYVIPGCVYTSTLRVDGSLSDTVITIRGLDATKVQQSILQSYQVGLSSLPHRYTIN